MLFNSSGTGGWGGGGEGGGSRHTPPHTQGIFRHAEISARLRYHVVNGPIINLWNVLFWCLVKPTVSLSNQFVKGYDTYQSGGAYSPLRTQK